MAQIAHNLSLTVILQYNLSLSCKNMLWVSVQYIGMNGTQRSSSVIAQAGMHIESILTYVCVCFVRVGCSIHEDPNFISL